MSSTHLSAQCRSTSLAATAGIPQLNPFFGYRKTLLYSHRPASYLGWTDRPLHWCKSLLQSTAIPNFTRVQMSHSIHQQLQEAPKAGMPQLGAPARVRSFVAKISNEQHRLAPPDHLITGGRERETAGLYPGFIHPLKAHKVDTAQKGLVHSGKNYMPPSSTISCTGCMQRALMLNTSYKLASLMLKQTFFYITYSETVRKMPSTSP